jgi:DNA-binding beta-propeller fold protein YncE
MIIIGNNIYINCSNAFNIKVVDLTTLAVTTFAYTSNFATFIPMFSDGVSIYYANSTGNIVGKLTGTTLVSSSGVNANYYPYTIAVGDYVYMNNSNLIFKFNKSDMTWVATLAAGSSNNPNTLIANQDGSYIYCLGADGRIQKISTSSFTITATFSSGISDLKFASAILYNSKIYIMSGDGRGSDIGRTFAVLNTSNDVVTLYAPPTNGLNFNTHNALNIDTVNNRLIFFGVNLSGVNYYNVEIINIP